MLAEFCHVRPWEIDLLTVQDFTDLLGYLDKKIQDSKQQ
jgi:hypothetical protein